MNKEKYTLQEVTTPALEREWLDFPKRIYKGNRNWVCPLDVDVLEVFNPSKNELFADGEAIRWVARDARGELVGRIAAFYNREKASIEEQPTGGCGFFESIDDQQVADMLFEASRMWLASRGMEAMDGPINFGQRRDWWGLLVEGYEFQPLYKNPYNPPYYKELFENYGFKNYFNQHSFIWRVNDSEANKQIFARAERLYTVPGYRVENIDMNNLEEAAESFRVIYNKAWALFSGVKPMTQEEALEMVREMKPIIDPNIIFFAYFNEEPIGFFITVKYWQFLERTKNPYKSMELAWIGDFNPVMNRMIETYVCATRHKVHTTYRYLFDRTKEFHRCPRLGVKRRSE